jgi:threonine dehydrogenase-like Zn-dependent dehydrogenase
VAGCGHCDGCATGDPVTCVDGPQVFGSGVLPGGQATAVAVPAADFQMLRIPEGMDDEAALLLTDNLSPGGSGPSGPTSRRVGPWWCSGWAPSVSVPSVSALALGAGRVLAVDPVAGRRALAAASGAIPSRARRWRRSWRPPAGGGPTRSSTPWRWMPPSTTPSPVSEPGGTVSVIGVHDLEPYPLPILMALFRSVTLRMTTAPVHQTWKELVPLVASGRLRTDGIFTHQFALADAARPMPPWPPAAADCIKVMLRP